MSADWNTFYRWEWFRRDQWLASYPSLSQRGRAWLASFARALGDTHGKIVLDCSCGLGAKTVALREMGFQTFGSDACSFAVEKAGELARQKSLDVEYFVSTWAELPNRTSTRFHGVFNDALSWIATEEEFEASIRGIRDVLLPGGVLVFLGAREGDPVEAGAELMQKEIERNPKFTIEWRHVAQETECTCLLAREAGEDYMDLHRLYLIREPSGQRLETATIRNPFCWDWPRLERLFVRAGYSRLETRESSDKIGVNVAVR
jgi:SAM-dependent methyltransferase